MRHTGAIWSDDWGWGVPVLGLRAGMWIGCGNYDGETATFLCFVVVSTPRLLLWLKRVDCAAEVEIVASAIDRVLAKDDHIRAVRWSGRSRAVDQ